jgi:hypothetical protein
MTFDEFVAKLDQKNQQYEELKLSVKFHNARKPITFAPKGKDLFELVSSHLSRRLFPLVDKRLGIVLGVEGSIHKDLRCELFRYHNTPKNPNGNWINPNECADKWVSEGMGWYISSMSEYTTRTIIAGHKYRPDRFDKDCFQMFKVDFTI